MHARRDKGTQKIFYARWIVLGALVFLFGNKSFAQEHPDARQTAFHVNGLYVPPDGSGSFSLEGSDLPAHLELRFQGAFMALQEPLTLIKDGEVVRALVEDQTLMGLSFAGGYKNRFAGGLFLPVLVAQKGELPGKDLGAVDSFAIGDLDIFAKGVLYENKDLGLGLALSTHIIAPTGSTTAYVGYGDWAWNNLLIAQWELGPVTTLVNAGYYLQPERVLLNIVDDDKIQTGLAVKYVDPGGFWEAGVETTARIPALDYAERPEQLGVEVLAGARFFLDRWVFTPGGGGGLVRAYGVPNTREFLGVSYRYQIDLDSDKDGILYFDDVCPEETEDKDGFEDVDGCIDPDNDKDGILDVDDKCPDEVEDFDNFEDQDGCIDPDNDQDGILDADDLCVGAPEDKDGFKDEDGCPDLDHDEDGLLNEDDKCPDLAEDIDTFEDEDGCPDLDNDKDGIPDMRDRCPLKKETYNGNEDEDGCPDKKLRKIVLTKTEIKIPQKILFKVNKANVKKKSKKVLKDLVKLLKKNPDVILLQIGGHTDQKGSAAYNLKLSIRRAEAVKKYLVKKGIAPDRLQAQGFGSMQLIDERRTKAAAKRNRRVQFKVLEMKSEEVILKEGEALPEGMIIKKKESELPMAPLPLPEPKSQPKAKSKSK